MNELNLVQMGEVNGGYGPSWVRLGQLIAKKLTGSSQQEKKKERPNVHIQGSNGYQQ